MSVWLVDGVPAETVPVSDRGLHYGDGLFETIAVRDGRARFLDLHLQRLASGLQRLRIPSPDIRNLASEVQRVASGCEYAAAKIIITRGSGPRGYRPPVDPDPTRIVGVVPSTPPPRHHYRDGIALRVCETRMTGNPATAGIKTLDRLEQVLARAEWDDPEIAEGLMLDLQHRVVSGTMTNVFFVRDGRLYTPPLIAAGVAGVMRGLVLQQARAAGFDSREDYARLADLIHATEIFVTNSQIGIWPVCCLEQRSFEPGPRTRWLMRRLAEVGVEECLEC